MIFARALPEKVKITETYEVDQVISVNPRRTQGKQHAGRIEITVPYDGQRYFSRQAGRDVERARGGSRPAADPDATIGHLVLAEHDHIENLPAGVRMRAEYGVIPIAVPLPGSAHLTAGRSSSVITHEYQPKYPEIVPARLEIDVMDPDGLDYMSLAEALAETEEDTGQYAKVVGRIRQKVGFQNVLLIRMSVHLLLPYNPERPDVPPMTLKPVVRRVTIGWPTITSLHTTELEAYAAVEQGGRQIEPTDWRPFPVRYNPVDRRLEWEKLGMGRVAEDGDGARARTVNYESPPMRLLIEHPGELYRTPQLKVSAEIEIPGYLMSGLEPRLFNAIGREVPRSTETGREPLPALTTRVTVNGTLVVDDAFAKRSFSPYHNIVFDDIIPDEMRVTDIRNVLKSLGFSEIEDKKAGADDPDNPEWFLRAKRSRGPDQMDLWVYVEGTRHILEREQIMGDSRVKTKGGKATGQIRLHMLGRLPRDHREMTREMNALQKALRDRYQYHMASRR
jgi:hypothetical protein